MKKCTKPAAKPIGLKDAVSSAKLVYSDDDDFFAAMGSDSEDDISITKKRGKGQTTSRLATFIT